MQVNRIGERDILLAAEDLEVDRRREREQLIPQAGNPTITTDSPKLNVFPDRLQDFRLGRHMMADCSRPVVHESRSQSECSLSAQPLRILQSDARVK